MKNAIRSLGFYVLFLGITLLFAVLASVQYSRTKDLKRALAEQKSKFDRESSYVVETAESTVLDAVKVQSEKFVVAVANDDGLSVDASLLVRKSGKRFFFVVKKQNCSTCLEKELLFIQNSFSEKQKGKLALLLNMPNARDRRIFSKKHGIATYHVLESNDVLFGKHVHSMMCFTVDEYLTINSVYIPVSFLPNLSEQYLRFISSKI